MPPLGTINQRNEGNRSGLWMRPPSQHSHFAALSKFACSVPPRKPLSSHTILRGSDADGMDGTKDGSDHASGGSNNKPQVCNPPMVHSLGWSPSGATLAAGLGDGSIAVFSIENRTLVQTGLLSTGCGGASHDSSVASVAFPSFSRQSAERIVSSAGTDGSIFFWDLGHGCGDGYGDDGRDPIGDDAFCPTHLFASLSLKRHGDKEENDSVTRRAAFCSGRPQVLFGIPHGQKLNWITPAVNMNSTSSGHGDTLFVADTSMDITAYTIPLRS
jgi:WD40 repeat protein